MRLPHLHGPYSLPALQGFDEADKSVTINKPPPAAGSGTADQQHSQQDGNQQQQDIITQQQQRQEQVPMYEGREVSRLVIRTVFFDEATLMATGQPAPRSGKALAAVAAHIQQHQLKRCRQVEGWGWGIVGVCAPGPGHWPSSAVRRRNFLAPCREPAALLCVVHDVAA